MATGKDYMLQGMAHPKDIKGCSQSSGRSGPIKQNVCDIKDTNKNKISLLKQMHSEDCFSSRDSKILLTFRVPSKQGSETLQTV